MFVDSHCHLNYAGLAERQQEVLDAARAAGVTTMLNISTRAAEWSAVLATAEHEPDVWASVGIHPHDADTHDDIETALLVERAEHPRIIGIGETGLDYFYEKSDRKRQRASFRRHIAAARTTGLPLIVHSRDAEEDTKAILSEEMGKGAFTAVIHCFTGSADLAARRCSTSASRSLCRGIVTFKNAADLRETAHRSRATGCWWKPTARSSRRCRIAASRASQLSSPIRRASSPMS